MLSFTFSLSLGDLLKIYLLLTASETFSEYRRQISGDSLNLSNSEFLDKLLDKALEVFSEVFSEKLQQ